MRNSGFSLLELLVVMAIAAILIGAAVPSYRNFMLSAQRSEASTSLYTSLLKARSEAVKRNQSVFVCRRDYFDNSAPPPCDEDADGTWDEGWILFVPEDGAWSGNEPTTEDEVIAVGEPVGGSVDISETLGNPIYLSFGPNGRVSDAATFTICAAGRSEGREIRMTVSGFMSLREVSTCPG